MEILLTSIERIAIVSCATGIVLFTLIMVLCFILKGCPLHSHLEEAERMKRNVVTEKASLTQYSKNSLTKASYKLSDTGSRNHSNRDSTYSSMSEDSRASSPVPSSRNSLKSSIVSHFRSLSNEKLFGTLINDNNFAGILCYDLQYICEENNLGKLMITLSEAKDLCGKDVQESMNPFFRIQVYKNRRTLSGLESTCLKEFLTHEARKTKNPLYNQGFCTDLPLVDFKDITLYIKLYDKDKHTNPTLIGQIIQPLCDLKSLTESSTKLSFTKDIIQCHENNGQILFGMSYLPTAQRLSVSIIRANNLDFKKHTNTLENFNCFVRVFMLGPHERVLKKKKTTRKLGTAHPQYNETLIFDVSVAQLEYISLLLVVTMRKDEDECMSITSEDSDGNIDTLNHNTPRKRKHRDLHIGKTILGKNVTSETGREHWKEMLDNPRKVITKSYMLN